MELLFIHLSGPAACSRIAGGRGNGWMDGWLDVVVGVSMIIMLLMTRSTKTIGSHTRAIHIAHV